MRKLKHGTTSGYKHYKCRCVLCGQAHSEYMKAYRARIKLQPIVEHGTSSSYFYRGCRCEICALVPKQVYANKSEESKKKIQLKRDFGISLETYNEMVMAQCGTCAVCGEPETMTDNRSGNIFRLSVHHNHKTGKVVALCCKACNVGMGYLQDNPKLLFFAAELNEEVS